MVQIIKNYGTNWRLPEIIYRIAVLTRELQIKYIKNISIKYIKSSTLAQVDFNCYVIML